MTETDQSTLDVENADNLISIADAIEPLLEKLQSEQAEDNSSLLTIVRDFDESAPEVFAPGHEMQGILSSLQSFSDKALPVNHLKRLSELRIRILRLALEKVLMDPQYQNAKILASIGRDMTHTIESTLGKIETPKIDHLELTQKAMAIGKFIIGMIVLDEEFRGSSDVY